MKSWTFFFKRLNVFADAGMHLLLAIWYCLITVPIGNLIAYSHRKASNASLNGGVFGVIIRQPNSSGTPLENAVIQEIVKRGGKCAHTPNQVYTFYKHGDCVYKDLDRGVSWLMIGTVVKTSATFGREVWNLEFKCFNRDKFIEAAGFQSTYVLIGSGKVTERQIQHLACWVVDTLRIKHQGETMVLRVA